MARIFRLTGASIRDAAIACWLAGQPPQLASIACCWVQRLRDCGADVRELMHDGCPTFCVEDAAFAYVNAFKAHVSVGFYQGAALPDPAKLLEGAGKFMRHVKLRPGVDLQDAGLEELIRVAHGDTVDLLAAERRDRETPFLL